jgi:hypothetical protein
VWNNTSDSLFSEKITGDLRTTTEEVRPQRIMMDSNPMDNNGTPHAAKLISTTALVQDFLGIPHSLAFIR